ncbi:hypothetical protein EF514_00130 [Anaerosphaera multitolerans]|uniref:D-isomer specific 2-hydroxyacid dehydrogenase catalytic domain-containing protein n=2 Tax=Anaerosphaera multitolerans TaxID=2487351 RepID=A0A437S972_9FIRM|nr:hypothetical protein EF514_00130 [Anaerosphaera multitolerans]
MIKVRCKMKVIIIGKIGKVELEKIVEMGYEVEVVSVSEMKKGNYNRDAEIVCGSIYMKGLKIEEFKNLKYIFLTSMGFEHLPLDYVIEKNIVVSNNGGAYSEPMGEWIVFNLLELVKKAKINILNQRELYWEKKLICGNLYGKKVLFLGTGSIAKEGAK